ncbi:MAG: phosphate acetyltransferase [Clostridia bacterium]|nr:phosphate acetyltransferase [Clostridia bacterium]
MALMDSIKAQAKKDLMHIVLPEGTEPRTVEAAGLIVKEGLAKVTLLGDKDEIVKVADGKSLEGVGIIDPEKSEDFEAFAAAFAELRKKKGVTIEQARETMKDPLYFATMMIKEGKADGMVAGAINSTGNTIRPALQIVKTAPGISTVSGAFLMEVPGSSFGENGKFVFGDCAITIDPDADQLAQIAVSTANTAKTLLGYEPKVAMLSFSTKGSAKHENVDKVVAATAKVKEMAPDLLVDGELQADAALVEKVGQLKSPGSKVAGHANVLIFPDLQAGNIGYKLVQRLAGAEAIGPICQGLAKPVNDLSRGCSVSDIVSLVALTAVQAQALKK